MKIFQKIKQVCALLILSIGFSGQPAMQMEAQQPDSMNYEVLPETRTDIKKRLFKEAISNQDTLSLLIKKDKSKKSYVIIKKVYVKVFKTVPVYVPVYDSLISVPDTLVGRYFVEEIELTKTPPKKKSLIKRIFHGKKKYNNTN